MTTPGTRHIYILGATLDALDSAALTVMRRCVASKSTGKLADALHTYVRDVAKITHPHAVVELRQRSYADEATEQFKDKLSDEYADYLVDLAGVASEDVRRQANEILERSAQEGLSVNATADRLGKLFTNFTKGRLRTIVRTESGRVMNKTRRDVLERALETGYGPDYLLYSAILDGRTTQTCTFGDDHYAPADSREPWNTSPLPAHWNCRSIRRFLYDGDPELEDEALEPWTPSAWAAYRAIHEREFPDWVST